MAATEFFDLNAELGSDDDDGDFDEETGEVRPRANGAGGGVHDEDSSEEEDDDDPEAEAAVRDGFIVDEDEDEEETRRRRRERKKRRREEREEEGLDEEDLDLIGELQPVKPAEPKFKRLKRGHRDERHASEERGVNDIFNDDEDDLEDRRRARDPYDEMDDFIEEDVFDDDEHEQMMDDIEVSRRPKRAFAGFAGLESGALDEAAKEDMLAAFGEGNEYNWALDMQDDNMEDENTKADKPLELKDVFEPSQLADRMLTDEDNLIKSIDIPERLQIARKPFADVQLSEQEEEARRIEEASFITGLMWPKKQTETKMDPSMRGPFQKSITKVLEFLNTDNFEVPFIFQHRKDYLIHASRVAASPDPNNPDAPQYEVRAEKLLDQNELWEIFDLDLKFRALAEKRTALQKSYEKIQDHLSTHDDVVEDMLPAAISTEEIQDVQEYVHFQYSAELKDIDAANGESNGVQKKARTSADVFERLRASNTYAVVRSFGITADAFARSVLDPARRGNTEDPQQMPEDMADEYVGVSEYSTSSQVLRAAKAMFAEEIYMNPRMRKVVRSTFYEHASFDCLRTEKGLRKIDEEHPYYEFKYLRNQTIRLLAQRPEMFLKMLQAEEQGLIEIQIKLDNEESFKRSLFKTLQSDNLSEVADAWNNARKEVLDLALQRLARIMIKGVKEHVRNECENILAKACRDVYYKKLDQAPYKPKGMVLGTQARVLAISNGAGLANKDPIMWAYIDENGRLLENGKFTDLRPAVAEKGIPDGVDVAIFQEVVERRIPDVIAVSGFSVETRQLYKDLQTIVDAKEIMGNTYQDENDNEKRDKIDVMLVNDEVPRLYHTSDRAAMDFPGIGPLSRYCIGLARYIQNPMKEYASLGRDITAIVFSPHQNLLPHDKLIKYLETAMVDTVNLVGVEINDAVADPYDANLLPYVCGLGPRKAAAMIQTINRNGGSVSKREDLVGDPENGIVQAVGGKVWENCASFLYITFDEHEANSDYLDSTRVHPEDYTLGRKMAADALELDEEDVKAEEDEGGPAAVVRKLKRDKAEDQVNSLVLEMYAEQLEQVFNQRKRATLETIRAELQMPYEELRRSFVLLSTDEMFTMLTGETRDSLQDGMVVPVSIKRIFPDHIECKLDCGIEGTINESEYPSGIGMGGIEVRQAYQPHQTVQAKILSLDRKKLSAILTLREEAIKRPFRTEIDRIPGEWDDVQEDADRRETQKRTEDKTGRAQRVIKHPLFKPFNATQAEEFLGPLNRGDCVIRPSSKGLDHLAVTWKVSDNVFQHIDVLELDKENEFSVGRTLKIGGRYTYSDLDELIVNHVKAMAKKVDEITGDERFQNGSKAQTEQWLTAYMEGNPKRSMYAFCINRDYPGFFYLCFKATPNSKEANWPIKIIPNAFELQKNSYPSVQALKNGFKTLVTNQQQQRSAPNGARRY